MTEAQAQVEGQKTKTKETDLILATAHEIETLTKVKALNLADKLVEDIDANGFRLGGVLKVIFDQSWFEGYESFGEFVAAKFGFQERKARYLMEIYDNLVTKQIPWEKVESLGWTKLKDLARILTNENVDMWVEKAKSLSVVELQALLKGNTEAGGEAKTTSDSTKMVFKLKADQVETVQAALSKAKIEGNTEFDSVGLELICTGYLGGSITTGQDLAGLMQTVGWQQVLTLFDQLFPEVNIAVDLPETSAG